MFGRRYGSSVQIYGLPTPRNILAFLRMILEVVAKDRLSTLSRISLDILLGFRLSRGSKKEQNVNHV